MSQIRVIMWKLWTKQVFRATFISKYKSKGLFANSRDTHVIFLHHRRMACLGLLQGLFRKSAAAGNAHKLWAIRSQM